MLRTIVFDGDDTLWQTEHLYDETRAEARTVVEFAGLDGEAWEARERLIDVANVERLGHATDRFPTSCVEAYDRLCAETETAPDEAVRGRIDSVARQVFERRAPLVNGALETLSALRKMGYDLALLTKGDRAVQARRIEQSGLGGFFKLIEIVDEKTPGTILAVLGRLQVPISEAVTVGNSIRSDVFPSLAAGVTPIWIDAHVWEYERQYDYEPFPDNSVIEVKELSDLLGILSRGDA
jgi:putative hydrolase of the HAD superfamily